MARLGGDGFVVVLDGLDGPGALRRAADIVEGVGLVGWEQVGAGTGDPAAATGSGIMTACG